MRPDRTAALLALALAGVVCAPACAQSGGLHGRIELQEAGLFAPSDSLVQAAGGDISNDLSGSLRLTWEPSRGPWSLSVHYLVSFEDGAVARLARDEVPLPPAPPATLFDLTGRLADHGQLIASQGIDRLAVTYSTSDFVVRVGRQALTWGSGLVFRPMDLFDPFSPSATDTEYKPGADMVYAQWLFQDGSDLQAVIVPRAERAGEAPSANASAFALHLHTTLASHQTTWLIARDHGDVVAAAGLNGALAGATWNLEMVPTFLDRGGTRLSALANISDAVTLAGRNATVFAEYFHNGFGVADEGAALSTLPADLTGRLARGQVFTLRRDYLAAGLTLEVTPLFTLSPTLISDLDDASAFALLAGTWSLADNITLVAGAQAPMGPARTEYGGIPLAPGERLRSAPPAQVYVQLRRYF